MNTMDYKEKVIALLSNKELSKEQKEKLEDIFPELKESEDERIKKEIIDFIKHESDIYGIKTWCRGYTTEEVISWLEKQGEQKPNPYSGTSFEYNGHIWGMCARDNGVEILFDGELKAFLSLEKSFIYPVYLKPDIAHKSDIEVIKENIGNNKVEPKFHPGDWVILNGTVALILDKQKYGFVGLDIDGKDFFCNYGHTDSMRFWSIKDAKDGDVLYLQHDVIIYKRLVEKNFYTILSVHCAYDDSTNDFFEDVDSYACITSEYVKKEIHPATKEQRDFLFQKMKEAGYTWDAEKKELKTLDHDKVIE